MSAIRRCLEDYLALCRTAHRVLFERHLLLTNTFICGSSCLIADVVLQHASRRLKAEPPSPVTAASAASAAGPGVNWSRSRRLGTVGLSLGPVCHYWYKWLDHRFVGTGLRAVMKKLVFDTAIFSPFYILAYHTALIVIDGETLRSLWRMLRTSGTSLFTVEWGTTPLQAVNFFFVPSRYRVLYDNLLSFSIDMTYSHFVHKEFREGETQEGSGEQIGELES